MVFSNLNFGAAINPNLYGTVLNGNNANNNLLAFPVLSSYFQQKLAPMTAFPALPVTAGVGASVASANSANKIKLVLFLLLVLRAKKEKTAVKPNVISNDVFLKALANALSKKKTTATAVAKPAVVTKPAVAKPAAVAKRLPKPVHSDKQLSQISKDPKIIAALKVLSASSQHRVIDSLLNKSVPITFTDLAETFGAEFKTAFGNTNKRNGVAKIYLDNKYRNEPPETLATAIAHEATHGASDNRKSFQEELNANINEVNLWKELLAINPDLKNLKTALTPNLNEKIKLINQNKLANVLKANPLYKNHK